MLALAACSKTETLEVNKGNEISLSAVTGKNLTKAADGYCNSSLPDNFFVWAATQNKLYFGEQKYFKEGSTYKADGAARYWPASAVDFFAALNYGTSTPSFEPGDATASPAVPSSLSVSGYTVETTVANQKDFIYAVNKGVSNPGGGAAASLNFRHALSQIEFQAKNLNENIYVYIDGLKVANVKNQGDFSINASTSENYVNHTHDNTAESDTRAVGTRCSWTNQTGKVSYEVSFSQTAVAYSATGDPVSLTTSDTGTKEYNDNTMYLLPQSITPWVKSVTEPKATASNNTYFVVKALIYNVAGATFNPSTDVVLWGDNTSGSWKTKEIAVQLPSSFSWEDGKRYVYTFNFTNYGVGGSDPDTGGDVLTPITLEVKVDDFVDAGNTDVEVK